jgi:hypothetical protein
MKDPIEVTINCTELAAENQNLNDHIDLITAEDDLIKAVIAGKDAEIERMKKINKRFRDAIIKTSFCDGLALVLDIENQVALERTGQ